MEKYLIWKSVRKSVSSLLTVFRTKVLQMFQMFLVRIKKDNAKEIFEMCSSSIGVHIELLCAFFGKSSWNPCQLCKITE